MEMWIKMVVDKKKEYEEEIENVIKFLNYSQENATDYFILLKAKSGSIIRTIVNKWSSFSNKVKYFFLINLNKEETNYLKKEIGEDVLNNEIKYLRDFLSLSEFDEELTKNNYIIQISPLRRDVFRKAKLIRYYLEDFNDLEIFKNKYALIVLHFLTDLIPFVKSCQALGLKMNKTYFFYKEYPYLYKEEVKAELELLGANIDSIDNIPSFLEKFSKMIIINSENQIIIIEDGGFFVPLIHDKYPQLFPHIIGAVEQTTRGIENSKNWVKKKEDNTLKFPIISVATSKLKREIEPPFIADVVLKNIENLLINVILRGKNGLLLGFGTIGEKVAEWFYNHGVNLSIFDKSYQKKILIKLKGLDLAKSRKLSAQNKDFIIGASGYNTIDSKLISFLSHNSILISTSSEQYEIDIDDLNRKSDHIRDFEDENGRKIGTTYMIGEKSINVLADGYPINFWFSESMPYEASDFIMTLIFLSSIELIIDEDISNGINSDKVNDLAEKYEIAKRFYEIYYSK